MHLAPTLALLALSVICGCRTSGEPEEIDFERLRAVQVGPVHEAKNAVVRSFGAWQAFLGEQGERDPAMASLAQDVDWSRRMLIAVSLGSRPSGGYSVTIDRVYKRGSHWEVHATETRPAPGSVQTTMVTAPFDCVETERFDGRVVFTVE